MITFEEYLNERVYKGLKADLTKNKPHWDDLSKEEQSKYIGDYGNIHIHDKTITEFPIIFPKEWNKSFNCSGCASLTSLEGSPEIIHGYYICSDCTSLPSLKGAPKEVKGYNSYFSCERCNSLTSLKGSPETVEGMFYCTSCAELKTLEGAPKFIGDTLIADECKKLSELNIPETIIDGSFYINNSGVTSLKGSPKQVNLQFSCEGTPIKFTVEDVKKASKVKGRISV